MQNSPLTSTLNQLRAFRDRLSGQDSTLTSYGLNSLLIKIDTPLTVIPLPLVNNTQQEMVRNQQIISEWVEVGCVFRTFSETYNTNNQFLEPLGTSDKYVISHPNSASSLGEIEFLLDGSMPYFRKNKIGTGFTSFTKQVEVFLSHIDNGPFRILHPSLGYLNVAVDGSIVKDYAHYLPGGGVWCRMNLVKVRYDDESKLPDAKKFITPPSFLDKVKDAYSKVKSTISDGFKIVNMTASILSETTSKISILTQENQYYANRMSALPTKVAPIFAPLNRYFDSIRALRKAVDTMQTTPSVVQSQIDTLILNIHTAFGGIPKKRSDLSDEQLRKLSASEPDPSSPNAPALSLPIRMVSDTQADLSTSEMYQEMIFDMMEGDSITNLSSSQALYSWNNDDIITAETMLLSTVCANIVTATQTADQIVYGNLQSLDHVIMSISNLVNNLLLKKVYKGNDALGIARYYTFKDDNWTSANEELVESVYNVFLDFISRYRIKAREIENYQRLILKINTPLNLVSYRTYGNATSETIDMTYLMNKEYFVPFNIFTMNGEIKY